MYKYLGFLAIIITLLAACKSDPANQKFTGIYKATCTGELDVSLVVPLLDTMFTDEPADVTITAGPTDDEIFIYVEMEAFVDELVPLGVGVTASVTGSDYSLSPVSKEILGGTLIFTTSANGTLSEDETTLVSTVTFTGNLAGTFTCNGVKQ